VSFIEMRLGGARWKTAAEAGLLQHLPGGAMTEDVNIQEAGPVPVSTRRYSGSGVRTPQKKAPTPKSLEILIGQS
jgi:hypothetical protein